MKKSGLVLALIAIMTISVVGCGGSGGVTTSVGNSSANNQGAEPGSSFEIKKPEKIKIMMDNTVFNKLNARDKFEARFEELSGIDLEIVQPDHDAYYDVVGQTFASGDWPDIMILGSTYYPGYASEGVLWDMTGAWENSELKASGRVIDESLVEGLKIDGALYGFAPTRGNGCVTYVKQAWLDNCGLDRPTTYEEFMNMCEIFTTGDPDGNGIDGDTYAIASPGLIHHEAPYTNYIPQFYQQAHPSFYIKEDGSWADGFTEDEMKDALLRLQDAYEKGYIDRESLTNGTSDCRNKYYEDKFGVFTYWAGSWATNIKTNLEANGHDGELVALEPLEGMGDYIERIPPTWCITASCENPEGVFKYFVEAMLDGGEMQQLWTYGVEDVHWSTKAGEVCGNTYEEGEFHMLESLEYPGTQYTKNHIDPTLAIAPIDKIEDPLDKILKAEAKESSSVFNNNSRMADLLIATDEMSQYNGDLTTLKNEIIALVITQGMSIEDAMTKYEADGGTAWSKTIVESLNK